jgi:hypothetical protein
MMPWARNATALAIQGDKVLKIMAINELPEDCAIGGIFQPTSAFALAGACPDARTRGHDTHCH